MPDIPTIAALAYRYGTIKKNEFELVNKLACERPGKSLISDILINQGFATKYQIGLLTIIQNFHVIQKQGIEFGRIAVEQGIATEQDIEKALIVQKNAFKKTKLKKLIGDILVKADVITLLQRDQILKAQKQIEKRSSLLIKSEEDSALSEYEQEFLKVKDLDKEFAKRVINKNYATINEIKLAKQVQKKEFQKKNRIMLLGDILVKQGVISKDQKNLIQTEQADTPFMSQIFLAVSEDRMEALCQVAKDKKNNFKITLDEIKSKLIQEKIEYGIFSDSLIQCYIDKEYTIFPVARGSFPAEYNDQAVKYFFKRNTLEREEIKKGSPLAEQVISGIGLMGKDIFAKPIERDKLQNIPVSLIRCGYGTRLSQDNKKAFAKKTGVPSVSIKNRLYIHPVLNVLEDADLRYGRLDKYADLNISGTLSDAYPVTSGNLKANEIRGTNITAQGDIKVNFGITGAKIRCQGNIQAKYIKNSTIEAFGNVTIQHEIIDSTIVISGKFTGKNARVIASDISAKNSIVIGASGSRVTEPCTLAAGRDDHILLEIQRVDAGIDKVTKTIDELREQREQDIKKSEGLFTTMVQLKLFHDKSEKNKNKIEKLIVEKKERDQDRKKTKVLLNKLKNKMKTSINSLKALNSDKKKIELRQEKIEKAIKKLEPQVEQSVAELERDRSMLLNWASNSLGKPAITINTKAAKTTIFKGVFSKKILKKDFRKIVVKESKSADGKNHYNLKIFKG